ncbi:MAG: hypothetical protein JWO62_2543 [Acidimicrobiaceae bacterium]|nr:hypothetical protein [Acidimicrobiaceae bacterium]
MLAERFEQAAALLRELDVAQLWAGATDPERRTLVEELVEAVVVCPDHLEVRIHGVPAMRVAFGEVGLGGRRSQIAGVGGPSTMICDWRLESWSAVAT